MECSGASAKCTAGGPGEKILDDHVTDIKEQVHQSQQPATIKLPLKDIYSNPSSPSHSFTLYVFLTLFMKLSGSAESDKLWVQWLFEACSASAPTKA